MLNLNNNFNSSNYFTHTNIQVDIPPPLFILQEGPKKGSFYFIIIEIGKILISPTLIPFYILKKPFVIIASLCGLGTNKQLKNIDFFARKILLDMGGEEIRLKKPKGPTLEGMYFKTDKIFQTTKTILLCTGSHKSYEHYAIPMVRELLSMGHNVMTFNYEGFGNSEGTASQDGVYKSTETAYQFLTQLKGCNDNNIVAWGYSLGSGAVSNLAKNHSVDIVLDRGFSTMSQVAYSAAPKGLKTIAKLIFFVGAHFDNLKKLKNFKKHVFIAQGKYDYGMNESFHGKRLQKGLKNKHLTYRKVKSAHLHNNQSVWFDSSNTNDRQAIEHFLARK